MKSTTVRRSNITREKLAMMDALDRYNTRHQGETFSRKQNQAHELDLLWQSFNVKNTKNEKAPQAYFITGFICGIIVTLVATTFISLLLNSAPKDDMLHKSQPKVENTGKFSFIPADNNTENNVADSKNEEYTVKEGDTLESIVIRFYGSFDMDKVNLIKTANKMTNPNALSIGQKLIIPINQQ